MKKYVFNFPKILIEGAEGDFFSWLFDVML